MLVGEDGPLVADTRVEGGQRQRCSCWMGQTEGEGRSVVTELGAVVLSRVVEQEYSSLLFPGIPRRPGPSGFQPKEFSNPCPPRAMSRQQLLQPAIFQLLRTSNSLLTRLTLPFPLLPEHDFIFISSDSRQQYQ
jgi:hypothetical protein